ncbi:hypothetical protein KIPB_007868 [Kipferlia bialata]|uniref:Uncharacterized protein n=1 Tax=Kipferlia bialata TaxID=797122 RepID=A0A9K3GJE9_9EUKA|nr:hypothetical protein KIPB_007868 [Kipferlia bialata]|eukprot:g7868.t1
MTDSPVLFDLFPSLSKCNRGSESALSDSESSHPHRDVSEGETDAERERVLEAALGIDGCSGVVPGAALSEIRRPHNVDSDAPSLEHIENTVGGMDADAWQASPTRMGPSLAQLLGPIVLWDHIPVDLCPLLKGVVSMCLDMLETVARKGLPQLVAGFTVALTIVRCQSVNGLGSDSTPDNVLDGYRERVGMLAPAMLDGLSVCPGSDVPLFLAHIAGVLAVGVAASPAESLRQVLVPQVMAVLRQRLSPDQDGRRDLAAYWYSVRGPLCALLEGERELHDTQAQTETKWRQNTHAQIQGVTMLTDLAYLSDCALGHSALVPHLAVVPRAILSAETDSNIVRSCHRLCVYLTVKGGLPSDFYTSLLREACAVGTKGERGEALLELVSHCIPDLPVSVLDAILTCIQTHSLVQYKGSSLPTSPQSPKNIHYPSLSDACYCWSAHQTLTQTLKTLKTLNTLTPLMSPTVLLC